MPASAADPHDIIGGLIGVGVVAALLDAADERPVVRHEPPVVLVYDDHGHGRHARHPRIDGRDARRICERALHHEKSNYVLRDIDRFDYDRHRGSYTMLLMARKHGNGKPRHYWCEVDAYSGRVDLDKA